jgi:hypothetical protein
MTDRELCREIQKDMETDAMALDGKPFNGRTVAEQFGNLCAAIKALALLVEKHLPEKP